MLVGHFQLEIGVNRDTLWNEDQCEDQATTDSAVVLFCFIIEMTSFCCVLTVCFVV